MADDLVRVSLKRSQSGLAVARRIWFSNSAYKFRNSCAGSLITSPTLPIELDSRNGFTIAKSETAINNSPFAIVRSVLNLPVAIAAILKTNELDLVPALEEETFFNGSNVGETLIPVVSPKVALRLGRNSDHEFVINNNTTTSAPVEADTEGSVFITVLVPFNGNHCTNVFC